MTEFVDLASVTGAMTRYYTAAALQQEAGAVVLVAFALCMAGMAIGMLWKWRRETREK